MQFASLIQELGEKLGMDLDLPESRVCVVIFDEDEVSFELNDGRLFIMADLGPAEGHDADLPRLLSAANLGQETGYSCLGIDDMRGQFTLCRILEGEWTYPEFEKALSIFVPAVRYWKSWLALPAPETAMAGFDS
jgi:hypothetical protein